MINIIDLFSKKIENNSKIEIIGRIKSNRYNKNIGFLILNDGTTFEDIQVVYKNSFLDFNTYLLICELQINSIVLITGNFFLTPLNKKQSFEIHLIKLKILDKVINNDDFPIQKKEHSFEFLRKLSHLRIRTKTFNAVFRIRSNCFFAIHNFFNNNNFIYINTPIITSNDAEGAGESFYILSSLFDNNDNNNFFSKKANLTVSGQLHAESFAQVFKNVYTFGPVFRSEKSNTTKHLSEFWMLEPEIAFSDLSDIMFLIEEMIKYIVNFILKNNFSELLFLNENLDNNLINKLKFLLNNNFLKIDYSEGINILKNAILNNNFIFKNNNIFWGMDLQTEHEKYLCEIHYKSPLFLINFPKKIKSFYMKTNIDKKTVSSCDLLVPGIGELIGGSERENNYNLLLSNCKEMNISLNDLQWYLDLRKFGYYKSSGFGLGFERLIMYLTGLNNIKDTIPFPRTFSNLLF